MKTVRSLVAVVMIAASFLLSANTSVENTSGVNTIQLKMMCGVTSEDVSTYLTDLGYTVQSEPQQISGCAEWQCFTTKNRINYRTIVYTDGDCIVGHTDEQLD